MAPEAAPFGSPEPGSVSPPSIGICNSPPASRSSTTCKSVSFVPKTRARSVARGRIFSWSAARSAATRMWVYPFITVPSVDPDRLVVLTAQLVGNRYDLHSDVFRDDAFKGTVGPDLLERLLPFRRLGIRQRFRSREPDFARPHDLADVERGRVAPDLAIRVDHHLARREPGVDAALAELAGVDPLLRCRLDTGEAL